MGISISNPSGSSQAWAGIKRSRECSSHFPHRTLSHSEPRAPGVPSKSLRTAWGCTRQILNPWVLPIPPWGWGCPTGVHKGNFHISPGTSSSSHSLQTPAWGAPQTLGTPGEPPGTTVPALLPPAWQVPHIHAPLHSPNSALLGVLGWGLFYFLFFFNTMFKVVYCSKVSLFHVIVCYCV